MKNGVYLIPESNEIVFLCFVPDLPFLKLSQYSDYRSELQWLHSPTKINISEKGFISISHWMGLNNEHICEYTICMGTVFIIISLMKASLVWVTLARVQVDRKHQLDFSEVSNFARLISPTEHMSKIINVPIKLYRSKYWTINLGLWAHIVSK